MTDPDPRVTEVGRAEVLDRGSHPVAAAVGALGLVLVVAVGLVALAGLISGDPDERELGEVVLPRLSGRPLERAQEELEQLGLLTDVEYRPNEFVPSDVVVDQEPIAGTRLEVGRQVVLEVSDGPAGVNVPDLAEVSAAEAVRTLSVLGLVGVVEGVHDEEVPQTLVVSTVPAAGGRAVPGSEVRVLVSEGPEPRTVPDVVGRPSLEGFAAIGRADLRIGSVERRVVSDGTPGTIVSIDPEPGERAPRDFPVDVVVVADPSESVTPDLVGLTRRSAAGVADDSDLSVTVRTRTVPAGDRRSGRVVSQSPIAGSPIEPGDAVTITVGAAPPPPSPTTVPPPTTTAPPAD